MRTWQLVSIHPGGVQRSWAISQSGHRVDLVIAETPDCIESWDITNAAKEAAFSVLRGKRPLHQDVEEAERAGPPSVTWAQLLQAKAGGAFTIMLKARMGRPPQNGTVARSERIELRLTPEEKYMFERKGGIHWLYDELKRDRVELIG